MAIVRELITRFGFNVDQTGVTKVEGSINRLSGMLSGLAAFASLRALANVGDSVQSLEARIGMLTQTTGNVGDAFNTVADRASNAKQSIDAYGSFYVKAGNATQDFIHTQNELLKVVDGAAFGLAASGADATRQKEAFFQLGQAIGSPVVQMQEMNTIIDVAPDLFRELGKVIPGATKGLKDFVGTGKVTGKMLAEGLIKVADIFEEKMRKMPMTIGTATTLIGNDFKKMIARLNRESHVITGIAEFMASGFKDIENSFNKFIDFVGGSKNALKSFAIGLTALFGPMALGGLISILGAVFSVAGLVIAALVLLGLAVDDIITYLDGGQSLFGDFIKWMSDGSIGAAVFSGALTSLGVLLSLYIVYLGTLARAWALVQIAALRSGAAMALAWLIAAAPMALILVGIAAVSTAVYLLWSNWDKVMGWMGEKVKWVIDKARQLGEFFGIGSSASPGTPNVAPSSVAKSAASGGNTNVTSNQTVNLTVPPGTPESQQAYLKGAAGVLQSESPDQKWARDISMLGL